MNIKNEIQYKAALERIVYLNSLDENMSCGEFLEWARLHSNIYKYEELHYPIEDINAAKSDT